MADFNKYYRAFILMQETLKGDFTHNYIANNLTDADEGKDELSGKTYSRVIDMDWVEAIEDAIPYIDKAIREQRRFIIQNEEIVPIEKARKITSESVRHLAQHTNLIARVEGDDVTPERILDIQREESFAIYENRFLRTLLLNVSRFVDDRYKEMKHAPNDSYQKIHLTRHIELGQQILDFELTYANESHEKKEFDINADVTTLSDFQRVRRLRRVLGDFSASPLIRNLSNAELVRPPIQRTNLMTKNPNFKKALDLWLFIESYKKTGFEVVGKEYTGEMDKDVQLAMYNVMSYEHFVVSIATNPALRRLLHEKYLEENARLESEALRPEEQIIAEVESRIARVREEETAIRLEEIREREKKINELNSQLNHAKFTLRQYETKMTEMKGLINLHETTIQNLKDQVFELEKEKKVLTDKITELEVTITEQAATIAKQTAQIAALTKTIADKDAEITQHKETIAAAKETIEKLKAECDRLTAENAKLGATVAAQTAKIAELDAEVETLRDKLYKSAEEIGLLKNTLAERDATIEKNNAEIAALGAELSDVKDSFDKAKTQFAKETSELKKAHEDEKAQITADYSAKADAEAKKHSGEIAALNADYQAQLSDQSKQHSDEVASIRSNYDGQIKTLNDENQQKLAQAAAAFDAKLALEAQNHQKALSDRDALHAKETSKLHQNFDTERESYKKQLQSKDKEIDKKVASERARYDKELDKKQREYDRQLARIQREAKAEIEKARRLAEQNAKAYIKQELEKAESKRIADRETEDAAKHIGSKKFGFYIKKK